MSLPESAFDLRLVATEEEPFAHVAKDGFIEAGLYDQLSRTFPDPPPSVSPSGYALYWGDPAYDRLLDDSPAWRALFEACQSPRFVAWALEQFRSTLTSASNGCLVDLTNARFVRYRESREDKESRHIRETGLAPDQLWVRLDLHRGRRGYDRGIHVDHRRRLMTILIYFCDAAEAQMLGGSLVLQPNRLGLPVRRRKVIVPRHNRMVIFPCTARSFHSVPPLLFANQDRRYVQIHISSSVDVWPAPAPPGPLIEASQALRASLPGRVGGRLLREAEKARHRLKIWRAGAGPLGP